MFGSIRHIPWIGKLLILLGVFMITETVFIYVSAGVIQLLYPGLDLFALVEKLAEVTAADQISATEAGALKWYQAITSVGRFLGVSLLFVYLIGERPGKYLALNKNPDNTQFALIPLIMIVCGIVIGGVQQWNAQLHLPNALSDLEATMRDLEDRAKIQTDIFLQVKTTSGLIVNILIVCIIAAVGEELLFRGVIQQTIFHGTRNAHVAVWVSAFLFSFIHMQFFGFFPRLLLGALMGYLLYYSASMWAPMFAHFLNNLLTVMAYYFMQTGTVTRDVTEPAPWYVSLIALPFVFLLLRYYMRRGTPLSLPAAQSQDAPSDNN